MALITVNSRPDSSFTELFAVSWNWFTRTA